MEELPTLVDTAVAGFEESLSVTTEIVVKIVPMSEPPTQRDQARPSRVEVHITDVPLQQADEEGPFRIVASLVDETVLESRQVPLGESQAVAFFFRHNFRASSAKFS